jgi:1-aminocyclopropane-1-carboxylate deaminase/D-cysteine desulfhydrase-like pyridoxal-dependent ACC family enzyme
MDRSAAFARKIRAAFAPCSLAEWPTPLEAQPALARALGLQSLWLKREDLAGGNKVRGLEFLLAGAPPRSVFVTIGGSGSSHCLATARAAKSLGCRTALAQFAQPETDASRAMAAATASQADLIVRASSVVTLPWAVVRVWRAAHHLGRGRPQWIAGGGADPRAVIGHFLATLELGSQLDAPPDAIVLPLGTGGTAAGIALGVAWLGWFTEVVAVRVAPRIVANRWRTLRLARKAGALLRGTGVEFSVPRSAVRVHVVEGMGKGYGEPTPDGERARALAADHGLRLDPTYGAKAFSFFLRRATDNLQRAVFWHTFPSS